MVFFGVFGGGICSGFSSGIIDLARGARLGVGLWFVVGPGKKEGGIYLFEVVREELHHG